MKFNSVKEKMLIAPTNVSRNHVTKSRLFLNKREMNCLFSSRVVLTKLENVF